MFGKTPRAMTILVCPLSQAMSVVAARVPERIVSLLDPDFTFPDFGSGYADRHLRIRLHDVHLTSGDQIVPAARHITALLTFLGDWTRTAPLLIHCRAGIGRSPAAAFVAACFCNPRADEFEIAQALRIASPVARPNEALVELADVAMGRCGRMREAIAATGRGLLWPEVDEGASFELPAIFQPNTAIDCKLRVPIIS
jgi:predicted protein tyrosine phosphatase